TSDTISESIDLNVVQVVLIDTAGIRASPDQIESMGVDRTRREAADADLVIAVIDGSQSFDEEDRIVLSEIETKRHLIALNKSDLSTFSAERFQNKISATHNRVGSLAVSAKTEAGLEDLSAAILEPFAQPGSSSEGLLITTARQNAL